MKHFFNFQVRKEVKEKKENLVLVIEENLDLLAPLVTTSPLPIYTYILIHFFMM